MKKRFSAREIRWMVKMGGKLIGRGQTYQEVANRMMEQFPGLSERTTKQSLKFRIWRVLHSTGTSKPMSTRRHTGAYPLRGRQWGAKEDKVVLGCVSPTEAVQAYHKELGFTRRRKAIKIRWYKLHNQDPAKYQNGSHRPATVSVEKRL